MDLKASPFNLRALYATALCLAFLLSGCGGGGGSDSQSRTTETLVYVADRDTDGVGELYAQQDDGSGLVKLSGTLLGGGVGLFKLSPDKTKVAYAAAGDTATVADLYVVNVDGTGRIRVSQGLGPNADVSHGNTGDAFWWSPDSTRLVYLADTDVDDIRELFLVNADGTDHHKISGTVGSPPLVQIGQAKWSPDSRYVAYYVRTLSRSGFMSDRFAINTHDTTIGGRNSVRVSGSAIQTTAAASVQEMVWSPDSTRIAYVSYENSASVREIYIANAGEGSLLSTATRRVNVPLTSGQGCFFRIHWSADSRYLLYYCTPGLYTHDTQNPTLRNGVNISGTLTTGRGISRFGWSPDSSRVAYLSNQAGGAQYELYSALPDVAASAVKLNGTLVPNGNVRRFNWSPDSSRIAYVADQDTDELYELYSVAAGGGSATAKVSLENLTNSDVNEGAFSWSPDGRHLAYEVTNGDEKGLYVTTPNDNLLARKVSGSDFTAQSEFAYQPEVDEYFTRSPWSTDSRHLIFRASIDPGFPTPLLPYYLYRVGIDETQPDNITDNMPADASVARFDY